MSKALQFQIEQQKALKCDYVLVKIPTTKETNPAQAPVKPLICPVKLNHHVFMQMSFKVLVDRCMTRALGKSSTHDNAEEQRNLRVNIAEVRNHGLKSQSSENRQQHIKKKEANALECLQKNSQGTRADPIDVCALHCFLTRYLLAQAKYSGNAKPTMTAEDLRVQLRAEYGVDVKTEAEATSRLRAEQASRQNDGSSSALAPHELTEEEFFKQISQPSNMAQECIVM